MLASETSLEVVVAKHFSDNAAVLGLVQEPAIQRERDSLKQQLEVLHAAKRKLPV